MTDYPVRDVERTRRFLRMSPARAKLLGMAVQPDKRPWERILAETGGTLTERYRVGVWTLVAAERELRPTSFSIRCDRPGFPDYYSVWHNLHDGWTVTDGDTKYSSHASPLWCLEWWAGRRDQN